jgi:hypothetical protein
MRQSLPKNSDNGKKTLPVQSQVHLGSRFMPALLCPVHAVGDQENFPSHADEIRLQS